MYNETGFLICSTTDLVNRICIFRYVHSVFSLFFSFRPLISASLVPQVFKWIDCLLKSLIDIHNGCLMSVFKEVYCMYGLLIEVIEFLLKI